jgi:glycosyltransferase involved in cell wall biosynthesis
MPSTRGEPGYSVIIPVYGNRESLPELVAQLNETDCVIRERFGVPLEAVFVVDGSPDDSHAVLETLLPLAQFRSKLLLHARNFGSFIAIRTGLQAGSGPYYGMIAADLQEPPDLLVSFLAPLVAGECDIVVGVRSTREDPRASRLWSSLFWRLYRTFVMPEIPAGGVDLFGCNEQVRNELLKFEEANSSLLGQLFWLGFRRKEVAYERRARKHGRSAWTFRKKLEYLVDSIFSFTGLPIRFLTIIGILGVAVSVCFGVFVLIARLLGTIAAPGYATLILVTMFFGALNLTAIGVVGAYVHRSYNNTKRRPLAIVRDVQAFGGARETVETERRVHSLKGP